MTQSRQRGLLRVIEELRKDGSSVAENIADHIESMTEVRTQAVRESTPLVRQQTSQVAADTARQTVQRHEHIQSVQKKQKNKTTVNKTTSRKGGKR